MLILMKQLIAACRAEYLGGGFVDADLWGPVQQD
jgi:hypothetical protein